MKVTGVPNDKQQWRAPTRSVGAGSGIARPPYPSRGFSPLLSRGIPDCGGQHAGTQSAPIVSFRSGGTVTNYRHFVFRSITENSRQMRRSPRNDEGLPYHMALWLLLIVAVWSGLSPVLG